MVHHVVFDLQAIHIAGTPEANAHAQWVMDQFDGARRTVVFNGDYPGAAAFRRELTTLAPGSDVRSWSSPNRNVEVWCTDPWRHSANAMVRELFLVDLQPDLVIVPAWDLNSLPALQLRLTRQKRVPVVVILATSPVWNDSTTDQFEFISEILVFGASDSAAAAGSLASIPVPCRPANTSDLALLASRNDNGASDASRPGRSSLVKPKLGIVSPLPPLRSGIARYALDMHAALSPLYDITYVVDDAQYPEMTKANPGIDIVPSSPVTSGKTTFDRLVYNFGNSPFHRYMDQLLTERPGLVIVHDFFLGDLFRHVDSNDARFVGRLADSYGVRVLDELMEGGDIARLTTLFPVNEAVVDRARALVVHSHYARSLAKNWYGKHGATRWNVLPLPRQTAEVRDRSQARRDLDCGADAFVVASFGLVTSSKCSDRLIRAWLASDAGRQPGSRLYLVGEVPHNRFGTSIVQIADASNGKVVLTGWADEDKYNRILSATDVAVQLRTKSRGETSAAALDAMKFGMATIVNANGSFADLPDDVVYKLDDQFDDKDLTAAIDAMWLGQDAREALASRAAAYVAENHSIEAYGKALSSQIEAAYHHDHAPPADVVDGILEAVPAAEELEVHFDAVTRSITPRSQRRGIYVDVSAVVRTDLRTGIQRVLKAVINAMSVDCKDEYVVHPIYLSDANNNWSYRHAREWLYGKRGLGHFDHEDEIVEFFSGDSLVIVDFTSVILTQVSRSSTLYRNLEAQGVDISTVVYDILPIKLPQYFPNMQSHHVEWLEAAGKISRRLVCISSSVANDVKRFFEERSDGPGLVTHFHLGADIENATPSKGTSNEVAELLAGNKDEIFIAVGTLEPRKRHVQILEAFEELWAENQRCKLVLVGKMGWMNDDLEQRLSGHRQLGKNLYWLSRVSDEELEKLYAASACLIAASADEGFGLPLIEAAQHKLPILARDIPVFREVAGSHASYFTGEAGADLAVAVRRWLELHRRGEHPRSDDMPWQTWAESARQLMRAVGLEAAIR